MLSSVSSHIKLPTETCRGVVAYTYCHVCNFLGVVSYVYNFFLDMMPCRFLLCFCKYWNGIVAVHAIFFNNVSVAWVSVIVELPKLPYLTNWWNFTNVPSCLLSRCCGDVLVCLSFMGCQVSNYDLQFSVLVFSWYIWLYLGYIK